MAGLVWRALQFFCLFCLFVLFSPSFAIRFIKGKKRVKVSTKNIKGLVHPKMKILSVFTHPHVVPNLCVFICSAEHKGRYLEECFNQTDLIPH